MSDPFATLKPLIHTAEIRYAKVNSTLDIWRQAHIAMPDLHIIDHNQIPPVLGEDGQEMTFERRQQLMEGKQPLFTASNPNDHSTAKVNDVNFQEQFEDAIVSEPLGASAIANRPKGLRVVPPRVWTPPTETPEPTMNIADPNIWAPIERAGAVVATVDKHGRVAMWFGPVYLHGVSGQYVPAVQHPKEPIVLGLTQKGAAQGVMVFNPAMSAADQAQFRLMCGPPQARATSSINAASDAMSDEANIIKTVQDAQQSGPVQV